MRVLIDTRKRVRSVLDELDRLAELEFPYPDSKLAIDKLRSSYQETYDELENLDALNDLSAVRQRCRTAVEEIYEHLPYLGFILRSTDVRNAFEAFGPLLRLAGNVLEPNVAPESRKTRLLMSSEWRYSPFIFHSPKGLSGFVLIGLPATESANPLLLPLTGHELGHTAWIRKNLEEKYQAIARDRTYEEVKKTWANFREAFPGAGETPETVNALFMAQTWGRAAEWALSQARETFCDFFGLLIFGSSYIKAFSYFLSPGFGKRSQGYPEMSARVVNLTTAARSFDIKVAEEMVDRFEVEKKTNGSFSDRYLLKLADETLKTFIGGLIEEVKQSIQIDSRIPLSSEEEVRRILTRYRDMVPAEDCKTMADILNAAWLANDDETLYNEPPALKDRKSEVLRELCLKNLEVFEIEQRLAEEWRV